MSRTERFKGQRSRLRRFVTSPVTSISLVAALPRAGGTMQSKKPLDFIMRQFHDAMEMLMEYEFDERFVASSDDLVLFEKLHTQLTRYLPISDIMVQRMRNRARG
jgi:hypothetical protein